jgi:hypothetical protein
MYFLDGGWRWRSAEELEWRKSTPCPSHTYIIQGNDEVLYVLPMYYVLVRLGPWIPILATFSSDKLMQ